MNLSMNCFASWAMYIILVSFDCSVERQDLKEARLLTLEQQVLDFLPDGVDDEAWTEPEPGLQEVDASELVGQSCCVAYEECLKVLARTQMPPKCPRCHRPYTME